MPAVIDVGDGAIALGSTNAVNGGQAYAIQNTANTAQSTADGAMGLASAAYSNANIAQNAANAAINMAGTALGVGNAAGNAANAALNSANAANSAAAAAQDTANTERGQRGTESGRYCSKHMSAATQDARTYAAKGVAAALAMPQMPALAPGKHWTDVAVGAYSGESAVGAAWGYQVNEALNIGVGISGAMSSGTSRVATRVQLGYAW